MVIVLKMTCYYTALVQIDPLEDSHGGERDLLLFSNQQHDHGNCAKGKSNAADVLNEENASHYLSNG